MHEYGVNIPVGADKVFEFARAALEQGAVPTELGEALDEMLEEITVKLRTNPS